MAVEDEVLLTKELKKLCFANGKEKDPRKSAHFLHKLGLLYKGKSPDKQSLIQSVALVTSSLIREPDNSLEIAHDLNDICDHILDLAQAKNKSFSLRDASANLKQQIEILRKETQTKLNSIGAIPDDAESEVRHELENKKIKEISELQTFVVETYTEIMRWASNYCESIMGAAPCQYALVGLGSLARKEVTPYSDFESAILLEDDVQFSKVYDRVIEYFRWFVTMFQVLLTQLGETPLHFIAIPCLRSQENPEETWFDDCVTPCGVYANGFALSAYRNPGGCNLAKSNKPWTTELIKPVSEMLKYLDSNEDVKNDYHLADILTTTCFVTGHREIYEVYSQEVCDKVTWQMINQRTSVLGRTLNQVLDIFTWYNEIKTSLASAELLDVKRIISRGPALFVSSLGRLYAQKESSCLEILEKLYILDKISENEWNAFKLSVTLAYEMRLRFDALFQSRCFLKSQVNCVHSNSKHNTIAARSTKAELLASNIGTIEYLKESLQKTVAKPPNHSGFPSERTWVRATDCVSSHLFDVGIEEYSKEVRRQQALSENDRMILLCAYVRCLSGKGKAVEAIKHIKANLWLFRNLGPCVWTYNIYMMLILNFCRLGKFKAALKHCRKMNFLMHREGLSSKDDTNRCFIYFHMGKCYSRLRRLQKALKYFNRLLNAASCPDDVAQNPMYYHLLHEKALCLFNLEKNDEAKNVLDHLIECRKIVTINGSFDPWTTTCLYELAKHMIAQGNYQAALDSCEKAWEHEFSREANTFVYLKVKSDCMLGFKRPHEAYSLLKTSLQLIEQYVTQDESTKKPVLDLRTEKLICLQKLIDCALSLKAYEEAVTYCEQALDMISRSSHPKSLQGFTEQDLLLKVILAKEKTASTKISDPPPVSTKIPIFLPDLDERFKLLERSRWTWQEASPQDWSAPSTKWKLEVISSLAFHLHDNARWKETLQATEYAITLARQLDCNPCGGLMILLLQIYLSCLMTLMPDCKTIPYMFTPSIYYHALVTIPAIQYLPNVWEWMWADIREHLLDVQYYLKMSIVEIFSTLGSDVQSFEDGNANGRDCKKNIRDNSSMGAITNSCHDEKNNVTEATDVVDDVENLTTAVVGSTGAVIKVGGCRVSIPERALDDDVEVTLTSSYQEDFPANRATPLLTCEPHGLKFNEDVEIALPTCYLTDGTFSVKAEARRSEDGNLWETVKTFDYTVERCFKFCIRGFSLYDVITERIRDLVVEKEVVCCIPHEYSHDPERLILIFDIFDNIGEHTKNNCADVMRTSFLIRNGEPSVSFQLTSAEIDITPTTRHVDHVNFSKIKQARFALTKREKNMKFKSLLLKITVGEITIEEDFEIYYNEQANKEQSNTSSESMQNSSGQAKVHGQKVSGLMVGNDKAVYNHTVNNYFNKPRPSNQTQEQKAGIPQQDARRSCSSQPDARADAKSKCPPGLQ